MGAWQAAIEQATASAAYFGQQTTRNGAQRFGHIPHVAPQAWFHVRFPPLSDDELDVLSTRLDRVLPHDVQELLRFTNGMHLFGGSLSLYGLRRAMSRSGDCPEPFDMADPNVHERPRAASPAWLIIGGYRSDGSCVYMDGGSGMVYRADRAMLHPGLHQWATLSDFLVRELERLDSHFDSRGVRLNPARPTTPSGD